MSYTDFRNNRLHAEVQWMTHSGKWHWSMRPVRRQFIHKGKKP